MKKRKKIATWLTLMSLFVQIFASSTVHAVESSPGALTLEGITTIEDSLPSDVSNLESENISEEVPKQENEKQNETEFQSEELEQNAKANDSPEADISDEYISSLAARVGQNKLDIAGLTDEQKRLLGKKLFSSEYADVTQMKVSFINEEGTLESIELDKPRASRANANVTYNPTVHYYEAVHSSGYHISGYTAVIYVDGKEGFCVDPTVAVAGQNIQYESNDFLYSDRIHNISTFWNIPGQNEINYFAATIMIWNELGWTVTAFTSYSSATIAQAQAEINNAIQNYFVRPSFHDQTISLKVGETITLTDANNVISQFDVEGMNAAGVDYRVEGDKLHITAKDTSTDNNLVLMKSLRRGSPFLWKRAGSQDIVTGGISDPINTKINISVQKNGNFKLKKVDEAGNAIIGAKFDITRNDTGETKNYTTNAAGEIDLSDIPEGVVLTAKETFAPAPYILDGTEQQVTVQSGQTAFLTFTNKEQKGSITIDKSGVTFGKDMPAGYTLLGNVFDVYAGADTTGQKVGTITTDAAGKGSISGLKLGTYTLEETAASNGFVLNKKKFTIEIKYAGQIVAISNTDLAVENKEQKGAVILEKQDSQTGNKPQGSVVDFSGAEFDLIRKSDNKKIGSYTTGKDGKLKVDGLLLGGYHFIETKAPVGYVLDKTPIDFTIQYAGQTVDVAPEVLVTKKNNVMVGGFDLIKTGTYDWATTAWYWLTGKDTNPRPLLKNVEFSVYKNFGDKALALRKVTDAAGYVSFDQLPYGQYRVSETKTPTGYKAIGDFYVTIDKDGQRFHYTVENKVKESKIKFVKLDEETGKEIVRSKAGFEIYSETTGEQLVMKDLNNNDVSVFYTDKNGILELPTQFAFGKYKAVEVKAPEGYILADKPISFSVTGDEKDGIVIVKITNKNQKGALKLTKTVETPTGLVEKNSKHGKYSVIEFSQKGGAGFEFKIRAKEDIVTGDNTVRLKAGQFVQKSGTDLVLVTNEKGQVSSEADLYKGSYELVEVKAPAGVVMLEKPVPFEIKYAGQEVSVTSTSVSVENNLQKLNIYGHKKQEVLAGWENGKPVIELEDAKNGQVFALTTGSEITVNGFTIPSHTVLGYSTVKAGVISFENINVPAVEATYYLREVHAGKEHVLDNESIYEFAYTPATNDKEHEIHVWADSYAENMEANAKILRNPIVNELARVSVKLIKKDDIDQNPLENVVFDLIHTDAEGKETVVSKHVTDENGEILVEDLPNGNYHFVETQPLEWYEDNKDDLSFEVTVDKNGQTIELTAINFRKPLEIETLFATTKEGHKQVNPMIDNFLTDYGKVRGMKEGHTYYVDTFYDNMTTGETVSFSEATITSIGEEVYKFETELELPKNTLNDKDILTAKHIIYSDPAKEKEVGRHNADGTITEQQVVAKKPKVAIKTKAHTDDKSQYFTYRDVVNMHDNVELVHTDVLDGTNRAFKAILVALLPNGTMKDIWESEKIDYIVNDAVFAKQVVTKVDTGKYPEGTQFFFKEIGYNEAGEEDTRHNFDGKDRQQGIYPRKNGALPSTGEMAGNMAIIAGAVMIAYAFYTWKKREDELDLSI